MAGISNRPNWISPLGDLLGGAYGLWGGGIASVPYVTFITIPQVGGRIKAAEDQPLSPLLSARLRIARSSEWTTTTCPRLPTTAAL